MAYWINQSGNKNRPNWRQFYCDTEEDVSSLPTSSKGGVKQVGDSTAHQNFAIGSECLVLESTNVYVLNSSDTWIKLS